MAKRYDESKVLAQLKLDWAAEIDYSKKIVRTPAGAPLSIHICGKLDYLTHYCGWCHSTYSKAFQAKETKSNKKRKKNNELQDLT